MVGGNDDATTPGTLDLTDIILSKLHDAEGQTMNVRMILKNKNRTKMFYLYASVNLLVYINGFDTFLLL